MSTAAALAFMAWNVWALRANPRMFNGVKLSVLQALNGFALFLNTLVFFWSLQ